MPVIPFDVTHPAVHRWHARQLPRSPPSTFYIPIIVVAVIGVVAVGWWLAWNAARVATSTHVTPPRVVQAPPGAQRGPVIAEILAGGVVGAVVRQEQERTDPAPAHSRDPPSTDNRPSQATTTNRLPSPDDNNRSSRTVIHQDAGPASQDDEDPPDELPPPYSSIGSP